MSLTPIESENNDDDDVVRDGIDDDDDDGARETDVERDARADDVEVVERERGTTRGDADAAARRRVRRSRRE